MPTLSQISNFGGIDADSDSLLDECFEDHEAFQAVKDFERFLVVGRKGSGKTAIFRKLVKSKEHDTFAFGHTFSDYPWHYHSLQKVIGVPDEECFLQSWKYLILITISKILLNLDNSQPWNEEAAVALGGIEGFVVDTYGNSNPDISQIFSPTTKLHIRPSIGFSGLGLNAGLDFTDVAMEHLPKIAKEVNDNLLQKVLVSLNNNFKYYICFDELDLGFKNEDEYRHRLIGLLKAAMQITNHAKDAGKKLNVIVFLRDDIYQVLQFEDKNKVTQGRLARIEWDTPSTAHTLKELMERRFSKKLESSEPNSWEIVFNETQQMSGKQAKYQNIIDRTMLRPRDMINFCNEALDAFRRNGDEAEKIENRDIATARVKYSQYLMAELDDELQKHIVSHKAYFEVLRGLEAVQFSIDELEKICAARSNILPKGTTAKNMLRELFEFSVIGFYRAGGAGYGGAQYVFRYKDSRAQFDENAQDYQIHLGLLESLNLKRYRRTEKNKPDDNSEATIEI